MSRVPRHFFVSEALRYRAYEDIALPIGFKQTISKPSTIARMVQALELTGKERVLEIGTGSGYQSAIIAHLTARLITTERIGELYNRAWEKLIVRLRYKNILLKCSGDFNSVGNGFDSIIVSAGAEITPRELFHRLAENGKLIIPVGRGGTQILKRYVKRGDTILEADLGEASFVPLIVH